MTRALLAPDSVRGWRGEIRDSKVVRAHEEALAREQRESTDGTDDPDDYDDPDDPDDLYDDDSAREPARSRTR